jgi:hypothetical protein
VVDFCCHDCGVDTSLINEYFMLHPRLWRTIAPVKGRQSGMLCVSCTEHRLGRMLTPADFTAAPINDPGCAVMSFRLQCRLRRMDVNQWQILQGAIHEE